MRTLLLNPGPVTLTRSVREAAMREDLCHREPEFTAVQDRVLAGLARVYECDEEDWCAVGIGGSGTSAMEAMVASLVPASGHVLILENGVYGERLARICATYRIDHTTQRKPWGEAIDLDAVAQRLAGGGITHLALVHHETTTGRLNPLDEVLELCRRHGVRLLLDAVSSFGAEDIPFGHPALEACAATANKCLHGIPGLAFVLCRKEALGEGAPRRTLYLHLPDWASKQAVGSTPYTPPVNAYLALDQALAELVAQGGWSARRARYRALAERVRAVLERQGVRPWLRPEESSCVLRSYCLPPDCDYATVHDVLKDRGFVVYEGQGDLSSKLFRVSTMGDINDGDMDRLEAALVALFDPGDSPVNLETDAPCE